MKIAKALYVYKNSERLALLSIASITLSMSSSTAYSVERFLVKP